MVNVCTVYVGLLDEGLSVSRPVEAEHVGGDSYRLLGRVPDGEKWQFQPGDVVICKKQKLSMGLELLAQEKREP
jgi:hypothetical protein